MVQIPGVYVEIKGDYTQLNRDMRQARQIVTDSAKGMSDALNNALSPGQLKSSINKLVADIGQLSRASEVSGRALKNIGVDLGELQKVTGMTSTQFSKLQTQLINTQAAKAQETALRNIGKAAGLSQTEIAALGKQFGLSQTQIANVAGDTNKAGSAFQGLIGYLTPAVAGFLAVNRAIHAVSEEFVYGLKAVEDFGMSVAQSTALITTFSQRAKDGDIAGAYQEANAYAKELTLTLEMIDQKTIANSKDLRAMSETFIANGVLLDAQNAKQVEGFTAVANALAIMTQGQNKEVQMRQEIRGLMDGEIRSQDKLGMLLKAQIPDIEKQLVKWRDQGVVLEKLGELLQGFNATTGLLENQWATVGSTMETIHNRILRGMFEPVFNDLIELAKEFNKSLMDAEGNLTPLARGIIKLFNDGYAGAKSFFDENEKGWAKMLLDINLVTAGAKIFNATIGAAKGFLEDYGSTGLEKAKSDLADIEQQIKDFQSRGDDWWEFQLFKDPAADKKYLQDLTAEAERLRGVVADIQNEGIRESNRAGAKPAAAPKLAPPAKGGYTSKASDLNAAMQAEVEALKAAEERKLAIIKASLDLEQQEAQNAYELGLSTYSEYLAKKNSLTEESLQATLDARRKELAAAEESLAKLSPITDKEGNARPDKDTQARATAEKKVEDAKRAVIEAEKDLQKAESEGVQAAVMAGKERSDAYKQAQVEALQLQGRTIEAARLQAEIEEGSIERQRLIMEAAKGSAGAQAALDAVRLRDARAISDAEKEVLERQKEAALSLAEMDGEYYKSLEIQTQLLDLKIQNAERNGDLKEEVALLRRQREELEKMKNPLTAMVKGWEDVIKHQKTASELMYDLATETAKDMQETFSDTFFKVMKGDFEDIGDLWEDLLGRMLDNFLRMIADMVAAWAATELFQFFTNTGDGDWFTYFSGAKGKGNSNGVGSTIASTAASYAAEEYLGTSASSYIMSEFVYPAVAEVTAAITGATSATAAAAASASSGVIASGAATPAIMDAYAGTMAGASTASAGTTTAAAGAGSAAAGESAGVSLASMSAYAGPAAIAAMAAAIMVGISTRDMATKDQLNNARITPSQLGQLGGISTDSTLTNVTGEASDALQALIGSLGSFDQISIDAASGVVVLGEAVRDTSDAQTGMIEGMNYQIATFNYATGVWENSTVKFGDLLEEMKKYSPVTEEAIDATAEYIATAHGIPVVADELAQAFGMMQSGIYGLAGASASAAGTIAGAMSMIGSTSINFSAGNERYGDTGRYDTPASVSTSVRNKSRDDDGMNGNWLFGSYAVGTDYVPRTGPYLLHQGEAVVPAAQNGGTVIHNHFYVDGKEIATTIIPAVDKHVASKAGRGQLGNRTAF